MNYVDCSLLFSEEFRDTIFPKLDDGTQLQTDECGMVLTFGIYSSDAANMLLMGGEMG